RPHASVPGRHAGASRPVRLNRLRIERSDGEIVLYQKPARDLPYLLRSDGPDPGEHPVRVAKREPSRLEHPELERLRKDRIALVDLASDELDLRPLQLLPGHIHRCEPPHFRPPRPFALP